MPERKTAKRATEKAGTFSKEEREAMRERARELKAEQAGANAEKEVLAKIAEMPKSDRAIAETLHAIVKKNAPDLAPKTWYGMPAYAKNGKVVCFFQSAAKFKTRYATIGFTDEANLDEGGMFPTYFALKKLTGTEKARIAELVKKAMS